MPRSAALSVLLIFVLASAADAQTVSATTGAIDGRVTDASNAVLPGVTVTLVGEAMMGSRDTVTSDTGTFRFISVTPGLYTVTFALARPIVTAVPVVGVKTYLLLVASMLTTPADEPSTK